MSLPFEGSGIAQALVQVHWGVKIPLRDGVQLNATLYVPSAQSRPGPVSLNTPTPRTLQAAPVIVTMTPYIAQTYHDRGLYFAGHGFPFLIVDVRGRGNSQGEFQPNINEARDGFDVVEWAALQPWCNGKVGMWGGSYAGYAQWATAKEFPPHLVTIVPVAAPYFGVDFPARNTLRGPYLMKWLTLVWGRTSQDQIFWSSESYWRERFRAWAESGAPFNELDTQLGCPSPIFQEWLSHPHQDEHWDRYNPTAAEYARLSLPILSITGAYDGDQPGALMHYRQHQLHASTAARAHHHLIVGPWDHAGTRTPQQEFCGLKVGPESLLDLDQLHLDWYDWTLRGGAKPAFLQKQVAYYVTGADEWRYADALESITTAASSLFLCSQDNPVDVFRSGSLTSQGSENTGPDRYVYDPRDLRLAALESTVDPDSLTDQRMMLASIGRQLVYHTSSFEGDREISGFFRLVVWLAIDQADTDFRAAIYDIGTDGSALLLSSDVMRARYRESLRAQRLIATCEPLRYEFTRFTFVSRRIGKGHLLRLVIGPVNSIYSERNYNTGGVIAEESRADARTVAVRLYHDEAHPSALTIPFANAGEGVA